MDDFNQHLFCFAQNIDHLKIESIIPLGRSRIWFGFGRFWGNSSMMHLFRICIHMLLLCILITPLIDELPWYSLVICAIGVCVFFVCIKYWQKLVDIGWISHVCTF